jgi:hypothetical protein
MYVCINICIDMYIYIYIYPSLQTEIRCIYKSKICIITIYINIYTGLQTEITHIYIHTSNMCHATCTIAQITELQDLSTPLERQLGKIVSKTYDTDFFFLDGFPSGRFSYTRTRTRLCLYVCVDLPAMPSGGTFLGMPQISSYLLK